MGGRHRVKPVHFVFPVECKQSRIYLYKKCNIIVDKEVRKLQNGRERNNVRELQKVGEWKDKRELIEMLCTSGADMK